MKAVIYCRVSSQRQVDEGHGIDGQELMCRRYAESLGYDVVEVFGDKGISGGITDRPGMKRMLGYLDYQQDEHVVIVDDIKRWARDVEGHFQLKTAIAMRNAILDSPNHNFEDTAEGKFVETILAGAAELERNQNRHKVLKMMKARMLQGYWVLKKQPGYKFERVDGSKLLVPIDSSKILKKALEKFASGKLRTQMDVCNYLNKNGYIPTGGRGKGKKIYVHRVRSILENIFYTGHYEYKPWGIPLMKGKHTPLITMNTYHKIQKRLKEKTVYTSNIAEDFPVRGFVCCDHCNTSLTACWSKGRTKKYGYYMCRKKGCKYYKKSIKMEVIHEGVESVISKIKPRKQVMDYVLDVLKEQWNERNLDEKDLMMKHKSKIQNIQRKIDNYIQRIGETNNLDLIESYEQKVTELKSEKILLGGSSNRLKSNEINFNKSIEDLKMWLTDPIKSYKEAHLERKRALLTIMFDGKIHYSHIYGVRTPSLQPVVEEMCIPELDAMEYGGPRGSRTPET